MADNSIMNVVKQNLQKIEPEIEEAQSVINLLKDAGEDTAKQEQELRQLRIRRDKWVRALEARGITV